MLFRIRYLKAQRFVRVESGEVFAVLILSWFWLPPLSWRRRDWSLWLWQNWQPPRVLPGLMRAGPLVISWWTYATHGQRQHH
jgi:hypothetical protein